jgi:hypothetical protein
MAMNTENLEVEKLKDVRTVRGIEDPSDYRDESEVNGTLNFGWMATLALLLPEQRMAMRSHHAKLIPDRR